MYIQVQGCAASARPTRNSSCSGGRRLSRTATASTRATDPHHAQHPGRVTGGVLPGGDEARGLTTRRTVRTVRRVAFGSCTRDGRCDRGESLGHDHRALAVDQHFVDALDVSLTRRMQPWLISLPMRRGRSCRGCRSLPCRRRRRRCRRGRSSTRRAGSWGRRLR